MPGRGMGEILDEILGLLKDREWHELGEILKKVQLTEEKATKALDVLAKTWIEYDPRKRRAKITPSGLKLLELPQA